MRVDNENDKPISNISARVLNALPFNTNRERFRQNYFAAAVMTQPGTIQSGYSSNSLWIVRKDSNHNGLLAGNSTTSPMVWPPNSSSEIQIWALTVDASAQIADPSAPNKTIPVRLIDKVDIVIEWNPKEERFGMRPVE